MEPKTWEERCNDLRAECKAINDDTDAICLIRGRRRCQQLPRNDFKRCNAMIQSLPEHNVGDQQMTYRMAANAIWNKLNFALSLVDNPAHAKQLWTMITEARALADSIVMDEQSDDMRRVGTC